MTRPEQPKPYPGDVGAPPATPVFTREHRDPRGRPLSGTVYIRDQYDNPISVLVTDGQWSLDLPAGRYKMLGVFKDPDGQVYYWNERVIL